LLMKCESDEQVPTRWTSHAAFGADRIEEQPESKESIVRARVLTYPEDKWTNMPEGGSTVWRQGGKTEASRPGGRRAVALDLR